MQALVAALAKTSTSVNTKSKLISFRRAKNVENDVVRCEKKGNDDTYGDIQSARAREVVVAAIKQVSPGGASHIHLRRHTKQAIPGATI